MLPPFALAAVLAQATTTSIEGSRVVGEPLPPWVVVLAGAALLVAILVAGAVLRSRTHGQRPERGALDRSA